MTSDHKYHYRAFGWNIESALEFPELLSVSTPDQIDIHIRFGEAPMSIENAVRPGVNTFTLPGQFLLHINKELRLQAIQGREIVIDRSDRIEDDEIRVYILASVFGAIAHQRGVLPIHASAVEHEGKAYLFTGLTGSGKSSIAAGFHKKGYQIYAEDLSAVLVSDKDSPKLNFGSIRIKLWADTMAQLQLNADNSPRVRRDLEKFSYGIQSPEDTIPIPIERLYVITPAHRQDFQFKELNTKDRFRNALAHTFRQRLVAGLGVEVAHFKMCEQLSSSISAFEFMRPIENTHITDTISVLEQHIKNG